MLAQAEAYLEDLRTGGRALTGSSGRSGREEDDPRAEMDRLMARLDRLERASEALAPRGGRQAARLRSRLVGERAQMYVRIGALVARWVERGGEFTLTMDADRTTVMRP